MCNGVSALRPRTSLTTTSRSTSACDTSVLTLNAPALHNNQSSAWRWSPASRARRSTHQEEIVEYFCVQTRASTMLFELRRRWRSQRHRTNKQRNRVSALQLQIEQNSLACESNFDIVALHSTSPRMSFLARSFSRVTNAMVHQHNAVIHTAPTKPRLLLSAATSASTRLRFLATKAPSSLIFIFFPICCINECEFQC